MAAQQDGGSGAWSQEAAVEPAPGGPDSNVDAAFKLQVEEGATVSATFPFFGDPDGGQLSFQIGDHIKVLQKDELWSWGKLEKSGEEGWFPHNYVQASFQPLPGMHELKQRILIKKAREEAIANGEDPDAAEALILNGGVPPAAAAVAQPVQQPVQQQQQPPPPPQAQSTGLEGGGTGLGIEADGWDWGAMGTGMGMAPAPAPMPEPPQAQGNGMNNGLGWGNQEGGDPDMFGMWMDEIGDERSSDQDDTDSVVSVSSSDLERRRRERKNIARELLETEDKYVRMLEALLATIIRPCLGQGSNKTPPLLKDDANELFGTLRAEEILAINTAFREQLRGRMATLSDETCFGDLFKRFAPFLKMYVEYCTQHENTASRVSLIAAKNDKFGNLLHRARSDPRCQDHDAQSLLIMPIQRIPRYKLLLEGMLKNTDADHPDRPLLQHAIEQISDVASFINDSIKRRENQARIWDLQAMLSEPVDLAKPTRIFVRSGVLTKLGRRYQDREDFFALFNDGLLHAKPATFGTKYVFKRIDAVLQVENVGFLKDKPKALHAFRVVTKGHIYLLAAKSLPLKKDWMRVLELAVRGGKRETIHKGPLRVLRVGKEAGVRLEYFYIFNDVVVRGKALWRGKFKHKETMIVTRVDPSFSLDGRIEALLPKEISARMAHEQTFRIFHRNGSVIVMAKSETDKALWLSSLEHQMKLRKTTQIGTVTSNNRIVHEDNFANLESSSHGPNASGAISGNSSGFASPSAPGASAKSLSSGHRSSTAEQQRRASAAATMGLGPVNGGVVGGSVGAKMASRQASSAGQDRRRTTEGSSQKASPLATTSDLLISLESSDEEDDGPSTVATRQSMPPPQPQHARQQQQQHQGGQQLVRRQTVEGYVSPPRGGGSSTAIVPANGNARGPSLLDKDLMAVFGAPPATTQPNNNNASFNSFGGGGVAAGNGGGYGNGAAAGGVAPGGGIPRSRSGSVVGGGALRPGMGRTSSSSSNSMPLLQPPSGDTPSYNRLSYGSTSSGGSGGSGGRMSHTGGGAGGMQQQQPVAVAPGAIVLHAGGGGGGGGGGGQFQAQGGQFTQPQQQNVVQGQQGYGMQQQGFSSMNAPQQQQPQQQQQRRPGYVGTAQAGGGQRQQQQQFQQFQQGFAPQAQQGNAQFAPQQQQQQQQVYQQQQQPVQQFQQAPQQQQQYQQQQQQQQQMHQQFQRF